MRYSESASAAALRSAAAAGVRAPVPTASVPTASIPTAPAPSASAPAPTAAPATAPATARDRTWAASFRVALAVGGGLFAALLTADALLNTLDPVRAAIWAALAAAVFDVLLPPLVTAGDGWLQVHGGLRAHRVRTDRLVCLYRLDHLAPRLVLLDADGGRVEFDPRVLAANPDLWRLLDTAAHRAHRAGLLISGLPTLHDLAAAEPGLGPEPGPGPR